MDKLNLPPFDTKIKKEEGKPWIFDIIRKKYIVLTPEEWVRQHFIHHLITDFQYPRSLFKIESGLTFNTLQKRSDIVVCDREAKPWMLVECKSPTIKLSQKAFNQIAVYNMSVGAKYLAVTNGMVHFCCEAPKMGETAKFLNAFPVFE
jgi:predicted type IV restriction endonuclease